MIKWGVLGTGSIARRFIKSLAHSKTGKLIAIASTNPSTREEFNYVKTYDTYMDLLNDSEIDVIYVAAPHKYHAEWSIKALQNGKHVLCEKPVTLNINDLNNIIKAAEENNKFFMEAMKTKFTPAYKQLIKDVHSGIIGKLMKIEVGFCSNVADSISPTSYILDTEQGGSWYDVSSYPISFTLPLVNMMPTDYEVTRQVKNNVDYYTKAIISFGDVTATFETAIDRYKDRIAIIEGTKGRITVETFNRTEKYTVERKNETIVQEQLLEVDDFFDQIEEVNNCIKNENIQSSVHSWQDSLNEVEIIEKVSEIDRR